MSQPKHDVLARRVRIERISRRRALHMGPLLALFVWGTVVLYVLLFVPDHEGLVLCSFKHLTGFACPTCGGLRQANHLMEGNVWGAFLTNPLLLVAGLVALGVLVLRFGFGRAVRLNLSEEARRQVWLWAGAVFLANWLYVITWIG